VTAATWTAWNPPPAPERDLWWEALRIAAPDTDDHAARHRRGKVRLPYDLGPDEPAGMLVDAWVCCDPACGGVELGEYVLEINHGCCVPVRCCAEHAARGRHSRGRRHRTGRGVTYYHGPFTPFWEPDGGAR